MPLIASEQSTAIGSLDGFASSLFQQLREASFDGVGITREAYGPSETAAHELIARTASQEGLRVEKDWAQNLIVSLPGKDEREPFIACGSHLDSVPQGGNFDGAAGVVGGLTALVHLKRNGLTPPRTAKLFVIRAEESAWFTKSWLGSHAMFGLLTEQDLNLRRFTNGQTLREAMAATGVDVRRIVRNDCLDPKQVAAFIELHIEQGPYLVEKAQPVAIVTAIKGNVRHARIICHGHSEHSGAVPRAARRDAAFALADLITRLDQEWKRRDEMGEDLVVTFGIISTDPHEHAISRIPGKVSFSLEIRAERAEILDAFYSRFRDECHNIENTRRVRFELDQRIINLPAPMDRRWMEYLTETCKKLDIPHALMPSGAGHDAAVFVRVGIPTAMIFIKNEHGSHNPDEAMQIADFMIGVDVLKEALLAPL